MIRSHWVCLIVGCLSVAVVGCSTQSNPPAVSTLKKDSIFMAKEEPANAVGVGAAKKDSQDEQDVVLIGRIGGSEKPFVAGLAAFTIVDPKVPYCSKEEGCKTPWDYCCEQNQVKDNIAMVKLISNDEKPVTTDARELLGVKELNMVVVHGKAKRDADGNLTVLASQIFVKE